MSACRLCARRVPVTSARATVHESGGVEYMVPTHAGRGAPICRDERSWMRRDVVKAIREAARLLNCADIDSETVRSDDTLYCLSVARGTLNGLSL